MSKERVKELLEKCPRIKNGRVVLGDLNNETLIRDRDDEILCVLPGCIADNTDLEALSIVTAIDTLPAAIALSEAVDSFNKNIKQDDKCSANDKQRLRLVKSAMEILEEANERFKDELNNG